MVGDPYEYDVAVSFAGAQRDYVEQFVVECRQRGLRVFYDRDMAARLWGRNFIYEFRKVYGGSAARFVIPFLSAEYLAAPYPQDEFAAAVEQGFRRKGETYLLPVVLGDVTIPPELLNPAIGFLRADDTTPAELAETTARQIERARSGELGLDRPGPWPAGHRTAARRPWRTPTAVAVAVLAIVCLAVVAALTGHFPGRAADRVPSATGAPTPPVTSAATGTPAAKGATNSTAAKACARQDTDAVVRPGPDNGSGGVRLVEASFAVQEWRGSEVFVEMAGRTQGRPNPGRELWILGTADPGTHDSNPEPTYGSTRYHIVQQVKPDAGGCWALTRHKIGYDCAGGLTFRYFLAALSPQQAKEMDGIERNEKSDGFSERDIQVDRRIPLFSTFDVPTDPNC